jgi:hypothetical protein
MLTLILKGVKFFFLNFLIEEVLICHRCQRHQWCTLICECLREFSKKIRNGPNGILWDWEETDS